MKNIENEIETVIEDDCEKMTDEMWDLIQNGEEKDD